jgi:protein gp37
MGDGTKIEWTDATANVINGCSLASPGCTNCYAMRLAGTRLKDHPTRKGLTKPSKAGPVWTGDVRFHEPALLQVLRWQTPRMIFWNAHGDMFHPNVPNEWIDRCFAVMALTPQHTHQVLTKRADRMRAYFAGDQLRWRIDGEMDAIIADRVDPLARRSNDLRARAPDLEETWPLPNVWLGVSVEDQARAKERIPDLLATPAAVRWLSCEPLLGPIYLTDVSDDSTALDPECWGDCACDSLYGFDAGCRRNGGDGNLTRKIDWAVVGGESGPAARPMHPAWARSLRDQCAEAGVPFLFKQWGEWAPICEMSEEAIDGAYHPAPVSRPDASRKCKVDQCVLHSDATRFDGRFMFERPAFEQGSGAMTMMAIGKRAAGRSLDGVQHDGYPKGQGHG